jgi:hypothetical protein
LENSHGAIISGVTMMLKTGISEALESIDVLVNNISPSSFSSDEFITNSGAGVIMAGI